MHDKHGEGQTILSLDIGSSSVRALLFSARGLPVAECEARRSYGLRVSPDGGVEAGADEILERVWECVDEVLAKAGRLAEQIAGVACATLVSNILAVGEAGQALTPLITYADTRPAADVPVLRQALDEDAIHQRTGCYFHPSYLPARFLWVKRTRPELLNAQVRWLTIGEYLALRCFGRTAVSFSAASWSGLLDRRRLDWDAELLDFIDLDRQALSGLVDLDEPLSGLLPPFARRWPALKDVPWFPAVGDGASANIGSNCIDPSRVAVTVGTSSAARATMLDEVQHVPAGLWCYRVDRRRSLLGGALSEGGIIFSWLAQVLKLEAGMDLDAMLAKMPPDEHGLTFLPMLAGERSPGWDGARRGALDGLTLATRPIDILQAGMEAVAYRLAIVFRLLRSALPGEPEIIASGGALLNSTAWQRILADVLGKPIRISPGEEASARGAALLAFEAIGCASPDGQAADSHQLAVQPDLDRHKIYALAIQRQQALYEKLR